MRIVLATPLYPPEIAEPAPYVKELAKRLSALHSVTVVAYAHLPEAVDGVHIVYIEKQYPRLIRLILFFFALLRAARTADVVYAINGSSIELPLLCARYMIKAQRVLCVADSRAQKRAMQHWFGTWLYENSVAHANSVIRSLPLPRPEIIPFLPYPTDAFSAYEESWTKHLHLLDQQFRHAP